MPNGASAAFSAAASRGNLWPSSMPRSRPPSLREAGLERRLAADLAHSSFDQPMGFAPMRIILRPSVAETLALARRLVFGPGRTHLGALRHFRTATSHQWPPTPEPSRGSCR